MVNPVLVALDFERLDQAETVARAVLPHVGGFKVGLEMMMAEGPDAVSRISEIGLPVFADAKLHDIPNTVRGAARQLGKRGARWVTVHASGGKEMIEAAAEGLADGSAAQSGVLAVTVLTSLDGEILGATGVSDSIGDQVERLAGLASTTSAEGVICSPLEIKTVKAVAPNLLAVTPGIRPAGTGKQDQKRVSTPEAAFHAGADYLVVGRAITSADDPVAAARSIQESLADR